MNGNVLSPMFFFELFTQRPIKGARFLLNSSRCSRVGKFFKVVVMGVISILSFHSVTFKLAHRFVKVNDFYPRFPSAIRLHFRGSAAIL
jgi:hypothetical protein